MKPKNSPPKTGPHVPSTSRRGFFHQTVGLAAGATLWPQIQPGHAAQLSPPDPLLPTIQLGSHEVTRLIIGGNPIYGHSHFNRLLSRHQTAWHTPERVLQLLQSAEQRGINAWQNSYAERTLSDLDRYRAAGGKMHWLCLGKPDWENNPHLIEEAARRKPIGIAPHGALADRLHRRNNTALLQDLLKRIRDQGVLVGLSAHNPRLIELAEEESWDVDYYMCSLYYLSRPREEYQQLMGEVPLGEIFLPSDPPRMFQAIQTTRKPCLAYKLLAAGRRINTPAQIRQAFNAAFENIKPSDAVIVGMYQEFNDQLTENAALVREICKVKD
jgi:hypothetical protein